MLNPDFFTLSSFKQKAIATFNRGKQYAQTAITNAVTACTPLLQKYIDIAIADGNRLIGYSITALRFVYRHVKPFLTFYDYYARNISNPIADRIDNMCVKLFRAFKAYGLPKVGRFLVTCLGFLHQVWLATHLLAGLVISALLFFGLGLPPVFAIYLIVPGLKIWTYSTIISFGATIDLFYARLEEQPADVIQSLLEKRNAPITSAFQHLEATGSLLYYQYYGMVDNLVDLLPWRARVRAERERIEEEAQRAERERDAPLARLAQRAAGQRMRAQQQAAANLLRLDAAIAADDGADEAIENDYTAALDQAIATNNLEPLWNYLRANDAVFKSTIVLRPFRTEIVMFIPPALKEQLHPNKYTSNAYWGDLTAEECAVVENLRHDNCVISAGLRKVPVYLLKPGDIKTNLDLTEFMSYMAHKPDNNINPETRAKILSFADIHYDAQAAAEIKAAVTAMRNLRVQAAAAISCGDYLGLLQYLQAQAPSAPAWHPALNAVVQKQTANEDGLWDTTRFDSDRIKAMEQQNRDICCKISLQAMRTPVCLKDNDGNLIKDEHGNILYYDLLPLLQWLNTNRKDPVTGKAIASLTQIVAAPEMQARIAARVAELQRPSQPLLFAQQQSTSSSMVGRQAANSAVSTVKKCTAG